MPHAQANKASSHNKWVVNYLMQQKTSTAQMTICDSNPKATQGDRCSNLRVTYTIATLNLHLLALPLTRKICWHPLSAHITSTELVTEKSSSERLSQSGHLRPVILRLTVLHDQCFVTGVNEPLFFPSRASTTCTDYSYNSNQLNFSVS